MKLSFEYLRDEILRFKARSFLQQGSIVILRSIFNAAEGKQDDLTTQVKAPADATPSGEICPWCNGSGWRVGKNGSESCRVCGGIGSGNLLLTK